MSFEGNVEYLIAKRNENKAEPLFMWQIELSGDNARFTVSGLTQDLAELLELLKDEEHLSVYSREVVKSNHLNKVLLSLREGMYPEYFVCWLINFWENYYIKKEQFFQHSGVLYGAV